MWGGLGEEFKYHLVEWDKACTPLAYGGWGFENLPLSVNFVREVAMEVWAGGKQILEISCYCKIWGGMGWMVFKTCSRHSWLWVLEEH